MITNINVDLKDMLVDELLSIAGRMREEPDPGMKMFLFSASYGMTDRVMRMAYDRELLLVSLILNHAYNSFMSRLTAYAQGDRVVPLSQEAFDALAELTEELALCIRDGTATNNVLEKMNEMTFLTTGAGHYMRLTGKLGK